MKANIEKVDDNKHILHIDIEVNNYSDVRRLWRLLFGATEPCDEIKEVASRLEMNQKYVIDRSEFDFVGLDWTYKGSRVCTGDLELLDLIKMCMSTYTMRQRINITKGHDVLPGEIVAMRKCPMCFNEEKQT
jgi:hypothetical protein